MEISLKKVSDWLKRTNWEIKIRHTELKYHKTTLSPSAIKSYRDNISELGKLKLAVLKKLIKDGYAIVDEIHTIKDTDYYFIVLSNGASFHIPITKETEEIFYLDENEYSRDLQETD